MKPMNSGATSINPRELLEREGTAGLAKALAATGYLVQERVLNDLTEALKSGKPHLIEGERGAGKTALAEALAEACNLPVFYLQGMEGLTLADVLYSWDTEGQSQWVKQALSAGRDLKDARAEQWSDEYLIFGEALGAYEYAARTGIVPILIVDEIDKLKEMIEDMLLQLFGRGIAHVPRYGDVGVTDSAMWPIVVLLSNDIRHDLSAPMRSRCVYTWMDLPTPQEKVAILRARVPLASPENVAFVAKLMESIQNIPGVTDKPACREGIDLLKAFTRDNVTRVDEQVLTKYLCYYAKRKDDRDYLVQSMARLEDDCNDPDEFVDNWVRSEHSGLRLVAAPPMAA
jgi:MoxR-like ATPase